VYITPHWQTDACSDYDETDAEVVSSLSTVLLLLSLLLLLLYFRADSAAVVMVTA